MYARESRTYIIKVTYLRPDGSSGVGNLNYENGWQDALLALIEKANASKQQ